MSVPALPARMRAVEVGCLRIDYKGRPLLVWVRQPVRQDARVAHTALSKGVFERAASGRAPGLNERIVTIMVEQELDVYVVEREVVRLGQEDMAMLGMRAFMGELRPR